MKKNSTSLNDSETSIPVADLARHAEDWLLDGEIRSLSKATLDNRQRFLKKLLWFLNERGFDSCGLGQLRAFLAYLNTAHETPEGRWGDARRKEKVRPRTTHTYFSLARCFFAWLVEEGVLDSSPLAAMKPPIVRSDQIQPFTPDQIQALLSAARRTKHPRRDVALVLFLLDMGARVSEVCSLKIRDVDLQGRRCTVQGKGNKTRTICFGRNSTKALWTYLREEPRDPEEPLFIADRGFGAGGQFTRFGIRQLVERLGKDASLEACRCSPHTFRYTFAVEFLRSGGNVFSLQQLLGHTILHMTNRYVALAQADIEHQHRQFSPGDRIKGEKR